MDDLPFQLNLRHLRALGMMAQGETLRGAAGSVGVSPSALTQGLAKLEHQLALRLCERVRGGVAVTVAGRHLVTRAAEAFAILRAAFVDLGSYAEGGDDPVALLTATQLNAFLHFIRDESFAAGVVASGLSRPALHRAVRGLEQLIGAPLTGRRGRRVALTNCGQALARAVRLAFNEIRSGIAEAQGEDEDSGEIVIGAMPSTRGALVPQAVLAHITASPRLSVQVLEGSYNELSELLRDGVIDIMVGPLRQPAADGLMQEWISNAHVVLCGRAGHPIFKRPLDTEALAAARWIVGPPNSARRCEWEELFAGRPLPSMPVECGSVIVIRELLAHSDLLTLLSPGQIQLEIAGGHLAVAEAPLTDPALKIAITTRAGWRPRPSQGAFIARLRETGAFLSATTGN